VASIGGHLLTPASVAVANPAFDVTPADLVTAIITELGLAKAPYPESLGRLVRTGMDSDEVR
jgi:methylthioribose-1-phosphate isomerase